jgi:hypothetical protein
MGTSRRYGLVRNRAASVGNRAPSHGGGESGGHVSSASDNDGDGLSMFAPPICRRRWRNNAFRSGSSDEDGDNPANISASGASNQTERDARAASERARSDPR